MRTFRSARARFAVAGLALIGLAAAGCSSSSASSTVAATSASAAPTGSGPVSVLYAGSLVPLMTKQVDSGFHTATGYTVKDTSAGSTALATDIKGKVYKGDVFISASPKATKSLMGASNGSWVSWYVTFASSNVVLGYNPKSKFASEIKSEPWYKAITEPGFKLGFTDPATDPKGVLVDQALSGTAKSQNMPALTTVENDKGDIYPEETLVARLQSGQLDAGFFYDAEAVPAGIPTVALAGESNLTADYTITTIAGAPNEAGAEAFVAYLLGPSGQAALKQDGFVPKTPPTLTGSGVPATVQAAIG